MIYQLASRSLGTDPAGDRANFLALVRQAEQLAADLEQSTGNE